MSDDATRQEGRHHSGRRLGRAAIEAPDASCHTAAQPRPDIVLGMHGAADQFSIGERIAFYRRRRGLTQSVLAGLVGRSEDWLSKIERGERDIRRLDVLAELAGALRVTLGDLLGQPVMVEDQTPGGDDVPAIRDALMAPTRLSRTLFGDRPAFDVDARQVATLAEHAWADFQRGRLGAVIASLPGLITSTQQLEDAANDAPDERAWAVSARVHHLAATTTSKIGEGDLAWMAAERALAAADRADDPLVLASAARAGAHALLAAGRSDDAMMLGMTAARWLGGQSRRDEPAALSLLGMLYLRVAVAAARKQDRSTTNEMLRAASAAANRLGDDANYWMTGFGPTNVALHFISTALELGDVDWVVRQSGVATTDDTPVERAVAYLIDTGRALSLVARDDDALGRFLEAERLAPSLVRHSASVRESVRSMHRRSRATASKSSPLLGLAERCRAVP